MSSLQLRKDLLKLAEKIKRESDLGFQLESILKRRLPLEARARTEEKIVGLLEELAYIFYTHKIYPDVGDPFPGFILTELEMILIKIEKLGESIQINFEKLEKIFREEANQAGFYQASRFYHNWNNYKEDLAFSYFYELSKRIPPQWK